MTQYTIIHNKEELIYFTDWYEKENNTDIKNSTLKWYFDDISLLPTLLEFDEVYISHQNIDEFFDYTKDWSTLITDTYKQWYDDSVPVCAIVSPEEHPEYYF